MKNPPTITCHDIEGNTFDVYPKDLTFRPAVYAVIIQDDKILLSKQWDGYDFPGGGIELGEKIEDALVREVKEETGVDVRVGGILYTADSFFKLPFHGNYVHSIHLYYECQIVGGELSTDFLHESEKLYADMPEWIPLKSIKDIKIHTSADVKKILSKFL